MGEAGPPAVMLHGLLLGNLATWYFTAAPRVARSHRALLYDLRGHGRSDRPAEGYDVATMVCDLAGLIDDFASDEPCALVGHSYGALIALRFALHRPERVSRLVLVEAPLPPSRFDELDAFVQSGPDTMLAALPEGLREAVAQGRRQARRLVDSVRSLAIETTLLSDLRAEEDISDDELRALRPPTLCVYGSRSACLPVGQRLARVTGARLQVLGGGHYLHLDRPAELSEAVGAFLEEGLDG